MLVGAPRMAASPCALECRVTQIAQLCDMKGDLADRNLVLGQVIGLHVDERYLKDGMIDIVAMKPIARCGYQDYTAVDRVFPIKRPEGAGNKEGGG